MSPVSSIDPTLARPCLSLADVDWPTYTRLLHVFAERPGYRVTYDRGELEIMSPTLQHDDDARVLNDFVVILADECGLPLKHGGSVTLRRRKLKKGIEADECYWLANASRLAGRRRLDLRVDPPPDLAIEVDVSHSSVNRTGIYAALGVPELWRLESDGLTFLVLDGHGQYQSAAASRAFPLLTPADLLSFLQEARRAGDTLPVLRRFRTWVQQRLAPPPSAT